MEQSNIINNTVGSFKVGDWVYASDWVYGKIVNMEDGFAEVEFCTENGRNCLPFKLGEITHADAPKKKNQKKETKHERFVRVAEQRTQKVLDDLKALSHCARTDCYEYSDEELDKIFGVIEAEFQSVKDTFAGKNKFRLEK